MIVLMRRRMASIIVIFVMVDYLQHFVTGTLMHSANSMYCVSRKILKGRGATDQ